jgi:hypothetical protein
MSWESNILALRQSLSHASITCFSMCAPFSVELAAHELNYSASHNYIKNAGKNSKYPKAFGDNDGMVSVESAKWVRSDKVLVSFYLLNTWSRVSSLVL